MNHPEFLKNEIIFDGNKLKWEQYGYGISREKFDIGIWELFDLFLFRKWLL
jgi:hypothetical protein